MKAGFKDYLESLGMKEAYISRVENFISECQLIFDLDIQDIFISEYKDDEGERIFECLWLFTESKVMEARDFTHREDFDIAKIADSVDHIRFKKKNFDLETASAKSRLSVDARLDVGLNMHLKATGKNCEELISVTKTYIVSNINE